MSVKTATGQRRHRSISVRTRDGAETMYCGLLIERERIVRDWRKPDCKSCLKRLAKG